jgi:4-hydroxy-tetrahydrodipicolinate synthase
LQLDTLKLTSALFSEVNPIPVKAACNMIGFDAGIPRMPLIEMTDAGKENLKNEMINYGIDVNE